MDEPYPEPQARVAVITGGGTGIGAACARRLATGGYDVVLVGRRVDVLEATAAAVRDAGGSAHVAPADVSDPDQVQELADTIGRQFSGVDVLVNNAGAPATPEGASLRTLADAWVQTYRVNTVSTVLVTTAFEAHLRDGVGRVVVVGSRAAATGAATASYGAAKAALEGYVRALAARLGPRGITANVVAPGFTEDTELTVGRISESRRAGILASVTLGRPGRPEEIAAVIAFLVGPDAGYVTGEVIAVDGGYSPWRGPSS
jgi:3-oxoacyl-[acyl-carrier protein] reductase